MEATSIAQVEGIRSVGLGLTVVESCSSGTVPIHLFGHFCRRVYRLATMPSITDRRTDRQTDRQRYHASSRSHCVQYNRMKNGDFQLTQFGSVLCSVTPSASALVSKQRTSSAVAEMFGVI